MKRHYLEGETHSPLRARLVAGVMMLAFVAAGVQGGVVALSGDTLVSHAARNAVEPEQVFRADILDRHGERLATSVSVHSLYADPSAIWDARDVAAKIVTVLPDLNEAHLVERLSDPSRRFVWLQRGLTPGQRQAVFDLGLEGIGFQEEARRFYPKKSLAAHIVGYTDVDGHGLAGIEYALEDRLSTSMEPVRLTLDLSVQYSLEVELESMATERNAKGGAGIVLDSRTGEVLALASWPFYDPNRRQDFSDNEVQNRATGAVYELGSVFKPLTVAAALDYGVLNPVEMFNVSRPIQVGVATIHDDHPLRVSQASPATILSHSSNIGTVQIGLRVGEERMRRFLETLGLTERSPVELPSSAQPLVPDDRNWREITTATVSFGHGISVSPLAFASAFSSLANDGAYMPPTLLMEADPLAPVREPRRVMSTPTAEAVVQMLRGAVVEGTGKRADIPGYRVAGKTGTAEKAVNGVYDKSLNMGSFAAVFPADDPKYTVLIVLDEPQTTSGQSQTAALNAAPAVGRVIERIAPILDVMPYFEDLEPVGLPVRSVSDRRSL